MPELENGNFEITLKFQDVNLTSIALNLSTPAFRIVLMYVDDEGRIEHQNDLGETLVVKPDEIEDHLSEKLETRKHSLKIKDKGPFNRCIIKLYNPYLKRHPNISYFINFILLWGPADEVRDGLKNKKKKPYPS
jgi:hypothetical protein